MRSVALGVLSAASLFGQQSALDPAGPHAATIRTLASFFLGLLGLIFLIVIALALVPFTRRHRGIDQQPLARIHRPSQETEGKLTTVGGIATVLTILILFALVVVSVSVGKSTAGPSDRSHSLVIERWLAHQTEPAAVALRPHEKRGLEVFLNSGCVVCHSIRSTLAAGQVGPDLTQFGSRLSIAAGALANNKGNLAEGLPIRKISNPEPTWRLYRSSLHDMQPLIDYLEGLQ